MRLRPWNTRARETAMSWVLPPEILNVRPVGDILNASSQRN